MVGGGGGCIATILYNKRLEPLLLIVSRSKPLPTDMTELSWVPFYLAEVGLLLKLESMSSRTRYKIGPTPTKDNFSKIFVCIYCILCIDIVLLVIFSKQK